MMRDADRPAGIPRKAPGRIARGRRALPWATRQRRKLNQEPPLALHGECDDPDALHGYAPGPARAVIVGLVPALLIWAALIALFKLLK